MENQLVQELTYRYQAVSAAYKHNQRLQAIIRSLLPGATWREAIDAARQGAAALPTQTHLVSILCLDIVDFTTLVDRYPLDQVLADLNPYLDTLTQLVYDHHGEVNKYLGDGFLAVFAEAEDAVQAGCALQQAAAEFNRQQAGRNGLVFPSRVGIDTGFVAMTRVGSAERQEWAMIGMPVNLAQRLQAQVSPGKIWFSQATFDRLSNRSNCRCLGPIEVKGRSEPVIVYERG